jgi:hypothetical protein
MSFYVTVRCVKLRHVAVHGLGTKRSEVDLRDLKFSVAEESL